MTTGVETSGGEGGIRTLGTGVSPYNGLANRRIRPLCHLSGVRTYSLPRSILGLCSDFLGSKWGAMSASQLG